jgi:hypothetical protein
MGFLWILVNVGCVVWRREEEKGRSWKKKGGRFV